MQLFCERFDSFMTHRNTLLNEVLQQVASRKGKMMRPMLTFLSARLFGPANERTLLSALTFEFFHTASLIHDDIVDESALRRGKPSVHQSFGNKVAVLVGDYILANALDAASQTNDPKLVHTLSDTAKQLADGELLQLQNIQNTALSEQVYYDIIDRKTAALFAACAEAGARSTSDDTAQVDLLRRVGQEIGICFQMRDDIFDYVAGEEIGKPVGNDMAEGKLTLPVIHALNVTNNAEMLHLAQLVKQAEASKDDIHTLVQFTIEKGGIDYAEEQICQHTQHAHALLAAFPDSDILQALHQYIDYVGQRNY